MKLSTSRARRAAARARARVGTLGTVVTAVVVAAAAATPARAEMIDVAWGADGAFEREVVVAPRRVVEACVPLAAGARVAWRFDAAGPLDFNVHYHEGRDVRMPVRDDAAATGAGTLSADVAQTYCWMWTNRAAEARSLRLTLKR